MSEVDDKLEKLAELIVEGAIAEGVPLAERLEAFKQLTSYHVAMRKLRRGELGEGEGDENFGSFKKQIGQSEQRNN